MKDKLLYVAFYEKGQGFIKELNDSKWSGRIKLHFGALTVQGEVRNTSSPNVHNFAVKAGVGLGLSTESSNADIGKALSNARKDRALPPKFAFAVDDVEATARGHVIQGTLLPNDCENVKVSVLLELACANQQPPEPVSVPQPAQSAAPVAQLPRPALTGLAQLAYDNRNLLLEGVPGTGKTFAFSEICVALGIAAIDDKFTLNCHPSTQYEDVIEGLRPASTPKPANQWPRLKADLSEDETGGIAANSGDRAAAWEVRDGLFLQACALARKVRQAGKFVAVLLDELNRANVPKILGDLMSVLEFSKRWDCKDVGAFQKVAVTLPMSRRRFAVPDNLIVVATMNSVDLSAVPLDQALLRRFWVSRVVPMTLSQLQDKLREKYQMELPFDDQGRTTESKKAVKAKRTEGMNKVLAVAEQFAKLNDVLDKAIGPDGQVGHSFIFDVAERLARSHGAVDTAADTWRLAVAPQVIAAIEAAGLESNWAKDNAETDAKMKVEVTNLKKALADCGIVLEYGGQGLIQRLRLKTS